MKVGIYCEFQEGNSLGGREFIVAVLCQWFARRGDAVEFVHHAASLKADAFAQRFEVNPETFRLRYLPPRSARQLWSGRGDWERSVSAPYDLFVSIVHDAPVFCHARHGILIVLFPFLRPFSRWADRRIHGGGWRSLRATLRQSLYRRHWHKRISSYQVHSSISQFAREWTKRRWRVETRVLYPPTPRDLASATNASVKQNLILSVGRFSVEGVAKRQVEMMEVFRQMVLEGKIDWRFTCAGGAGESPREAQYVNTVRQAGRDVGGEALPNLARPQLRALYAEAKIFWHAAGLGEDIAAHPELSEHYGISTVEAMTAGCVPVVINQGAQPEIVEHGVSGFVWNSLDELRDYTLQLMRDEPLRERMAEAAKERALRSFSRDRFEQDFASLLKDVCG